MSSEYVLTILQGIVVLASIFLGARIGGLGLGLFGVVGTLVLVFVFRLTPGSPSTDAFFIVIAVITAASAMQAAGGIDYLVGLAANVIQKNPNQLIIIAPLTAFAFTVAAGTGNIFFALIPIIYQLAYANGIRPERALAVSAVASQLAITSSPVSSAMAAMTALLGPDWSSTKVIAITMPASIVAILVAALVQSRIGPDLKDDPVFKEREAAGLIEPLRPIAELLRQDLPPTAKLSAGFFLVGVVVVTAMGAFSGLRPQISDGDGGTTTLGMTPVIQMVMFTVALLIMITCKVKSNSVLDQSILKSGFVSAVALFGFSWLANTFIDNNQETVVRPMADLVGRYPIMLAVAIFIVAALTTSQSSATQAIVPIGLAGLAVATVVGMWPAVIGIYTFPINGSQVAAVSVDQTGSTKIGKFVLNHSFMIPLLVMTVVTLAIAVPMAKLFA